MEVRCRLSSSNRWKVQNWVSVDEMIELLREATLQPRGGTGPQGVRDYARDAIVNNGKHVKAGYPIPWDHHHRKQITNG